MVETIDLNKVENVKIDGQKVHIPTAAELIAKSGSPVYATRALPTDGISTDVRGITHVDEALTKAGLNYKVVQVPIFAEGKEIPKRLANIRADTREFIEVVSNRYTPFQNSQAYSFLEGMLNSGALELQNAGQFDYGSVFIEAKTPQNIRAGGDEYYPFALIRNSHDGSSGVKVCFTFTRVVCRNTLALAIKTAPRVWQARHLRNIEGRMEDAKQMLQVMDTYIHEYPVIVEKMQGINITEDNIVSVLNKMFPVKKDATEKTIANIKHEVREIMTIYNGTPDIQPHKDSALGFMLAVSDYATHTSPGRETPNWKANRLATIADGHPLVEIAQKELLAIPA